MPTSKSFLLLILVIGFTFNCSRSYQILGEVSGAYDGFIYLYQYEGDQFLDSTKIEDGRFVFKGKVDQPKQGYLRLEYISAIAWLGLENSKIDLNILAAPGQTEDGSPANYLEVKSVKGSKTVELDTEMRALFAKYRADSIATEDVKQAKLYSDLKTFIQANPRHWKSGQALSWADELTANQIQTLYGILDPTYQGSGTLQNIQSLIARRQTLLTGGPFPTFTVPDTSGQVIHTSDLKGSVLLYEFWASWCRPCRKSFPVLNELQEKYGADGFKVVGVSLDSDGQAWRNSIKKEALNWLQLSDLSDEKGGIVEQLSIEAIPYNILVDREGIIQAINISDAALEELIQALL